MAKMKKIERHLVFKQPPIYCNGEVAEDWTGSGLFVEEKEGFCKLNPGKMHTSPLAADHNENTTVYWEEEKSAKKRKRNHHLIQAQALVLCVENGNFEHAADFASSLPSTARPTLIPNQVRIQKGTLHRTLPRDITPGLPAELGESINFFTFSGSIPPRTKVQVCRCENPRADSLPGFVYHMTAGPPHPFPRKWSGLALGFPLGLKEAKAREQQREDQGLRLSPPPPYATTFLCTQGFGGRGHHRGKESHHAVDFACPVGTPVAAMEDGVVIGVCGDKHLGGVHVDLLPECNYLKILSKDHTHTVTYLHLVTVFNSVKFVCSSVGMYLTRVIFLWPQVL